MQRNAVGREAPAFSTTTTSADVDELVSLCHSNATQLVLPMTEHCKCRSDSSYGIRSLFAGPDFNSMLPEDAPRLNPQLALGY